MASSSRGPTALAVVSAAFLALVASFFFKDTRDSLYCVSSPSPFFITTLNTSSPRAKCFRVENGIFTEVLDSEPVSNEKRIRLDGFVLPGIIESHGHILQYGEMLESVPLYGAQSVAEIRERIKDFLTTHHRQGYGLRSKWIRGIGWDQAYFGGVMPTAVGFPSYIPVERLNADTSQEDLSDDPLLKDLYIMLDRVDVHCVLTSQKVLDLLPNPLPDAPPGGVVVTDPGPGVFCDNAMDAIIYPLAPKPDNTQKTRWFKTAMKELNKVGIVGVGDAGMRPDDISILESMAENRELSIRINVMLECTERNTYCPSETRGLKLPKSKDALGSNTLMLGGVKLFADGALGSWGAALLEPYSDKPETSGTMLINETELNSVVNKVRAPES